MFSDVKAIWLSCLLCFTSVAHNIHGFTHKGS